jgi:hypothetical protein
MISFIASICPSKVLSYLVAITPGAAAGAALGLLINVIAIVPLAPKFAEYSM